MPDATAKIVLPNPVLYGCYEPKSVALKYKNSQYEKGR